MNIVAISGSLRKDSFNTKLLHAMQELLPEDISLDVVSIGELPLYDGDLEEAFPKEAQALKDAISGADALVIATPEYNRSMSGVLKNAIDWASRPYGKNSFAGKPVLVAGVSSGKIGTAVAQSHLKQVLVYLDAHMVGQPELYLGPAEDIFNDDGTLVDSMKERVKGALEALIARVG